MNKTKVGVNVPDVGTPLAVDGKLTRAEGDAVGDALGVAVGVAVAEGLAVNDGKLLPAAAITKLRVIGRQQQLIRMDFEKLTENKFDDEALFSGYCAALEKTDVVVLSDYSKGALCHVERFIKAAREKNIPVLVDPKYKNYERYAGATILTPNLKEFESVAGKCKNLHDVIQKAHDLLQTVNIDSVLITLGKDGMVLVDKNKQTKHFATKARDVFDVTGAGDTVIGVLAAGMAARMKTVDAIEMANLAAGIVVGRLGAATVSAADLQESFSMLSESQLVQAVIAARARGEKIVMTNGCFDVLHVGHADYLAKARALGDRLIVAVNDDASVRGLKGEGRPLNSLSARMQLLSALRSVDWVVSFSESTPARLISKIMPDILVKGGDYQVHDIAGSDVVLKNGGEVLTIPLTAGFSTTALIENAKQCASEKV